MKKAKKPEAPFDARAHLTALIRSEDDPALKWFASAILSALETGQVDNRPVVFASGVVPHPSELEDQTRPRSARRGARGSGNAV